MNFEKRSNEFDVRKPRTLEAILILEGISEGMTIRYNQTTDLQVPNLFSILRIRVFRSLRGCTR